MVTLTWEQVNAWRLAQQGLVNRAGPGDLISAVGRTLGIHAQLMSAAELAIAARVDVISPEAVQSALWNERSLIRTWAMRKTLHLIPTQDFPLYIAARQVTEINWPFYFGKEGINNDVLEAYLAVSPEILTAQPITRQQFASAIDERIHSPELLTYVVKGGWGMSLKPLAWRGDLCLGPSEGQTNTYVRPSAWIGAWQPVEPEAAFREILLRYLRVYSPAKERSFQVWWEVHRGPVRQAFKSIADELEDVDVEGWRGVALRSTIPSFQASQPTGVVRLLPMFDTYTIGSARLAGSQPFLAPDKQKKVFSLQGWVSAVVVVDGFIKGTWIYKQSQSALKVIVEPFTTLRDSEKDGIAEEAARLGTFFRLPVDLAYLPG